MNAQLIPVRHAEPLHRALLSNAWKWAKANPEAYLEGASYTTREEFLVPPSNAKEFFVLINDLPVALLTFFPLKPNEYLVGLITAPDAPVRRLLAVLRGLRGFLPNCGVRVLHVVLPERDCYDGARKLAAKIGFTRLSKADWKLELTDGNTRKSAGS